MALREIRMLKRLKHENLVTMIEVFRHKKTILSRTVLDELDKMPGGLGEERCRERIFQVVRAINYCHSNNIIHRDVKPENVLVSSLGVVKLCDFGFARLLTLSGEACTEYVATRWYRAPELLVAEPNYGTAVDVWAIGCLFAEMMTGDPLFPGESDIDQFYLIVKMLGKPCPRQQQLLAKNPELRGMIKLPFEGSVGLYKFFSTWPMQSIDFLSCCMKMDPLYRSSTEELLKHPYFTHDRFPQRYLPTLREKVNIEFNNPLLRKFKTEVIMSTDKKDEVKRRSVPSDPRWKFTLAEGCMKRKFSCEHVPSELVNNTTTKSTQKLNLVPKNGQSSTQPPRAMKNTHKSLQTGGNTVEMQMLEKSLESLSKFNTNCRPDYNQSDSEIREENNSSLLPEPPPHFQPVHYGHGDYNRSPNNHTVLHPSVNNISFTKDLPKKSPKLSQNLNNSNAKVYQVPLLSNPRIQFLKRIEHNVENILAKGDEGDQVWHNTPPMWLRSTNLFKRREAKHRSEELCLPNLPGATSPEKPEKKPELSSLNEVTADYRYKRAKRKLKILDISLPFSVDEKG
ncbi:hypothetical protein NQ317_012445 [Molorchus minor]|uniref:Protein kinase domain-containing protein n=1 Tax=Molorchus minor TaxID=1323400 RepID=A0ABQ9J507_9CUCU|nr:hypothetical protein NQ317_012445 [Molorchus minor]